jgi:hypothetical protein
MVHYTLKLRHRSQAEVAKRALGEILPGSGVSLEVLDGSPHYISFKFSALDESPEELIAKAWDLVSQAGLEHEFEEW